MAEYFGLRKSNSIGNIDSEQRIRSVTGFKYEWESIVSNLKAPFDVTLVWLFEGLGRIETFCAPLVQDQNFVWLEPGATKGWAQDEVSAGDKFAIGNAYWEVVRVSGHLAAGDGMSGGVVFKGYWSREITFCLNEVLESSQVQCDKWRVCICAQHWEEQIDKQSAL